MVTPSQERLHTKRSFSPQIVTLKKKKKYSELCPELSLVECCSSTYCTIHTYTKRRTRTCTSTEKHTHRHTESLSHRLCLGNAGGATARAVHTDHGAPKSPAGRGQGSARWSRGSGPGLSSSEGLGGPGGSAAVFLTATRMAPRRGHPEDPAWLS